MQNRWNTLTIRARSAVKVPDDIPLDKACRPEVLLAWAMNGQPLPAVHGAPLRVVVADEKGQWIGDVEGPGSAVRPGQAEHSADVIATLVADALRALPPTPPESQWANFISTGLSWARAGSAGAMATGTSLADAA